MAFGLTGIMGRMLGNPGSGLNPFFPANSMRQPDAEQTAPHVLDLRPQQYMQMQRLNPAANYGAGRSFAPGTNVGSLRKKALGF